MRIEKLTNNELNKLTDLKSPYKNTLTFSLTIIGIFSALIIGVHLIRIYENSPLFDKFKIQWSFPLVLGLISFAWYQIKVRKIDRDLKSKVKKIYDFNVESKGSEKYGTYSTGDYRASGSNDRLYITFRDYKYYCSKDEIDTYEIGDKIKVSIAGKSNSILTIVNASAQQ